MSWAFGYLSAWHDVYMSRADQNNENIIMRSIPEDCHLGQMRPSNAVRTVWNAGAIDTSHLRFRPIQKIATIHANSGFIRGIPLKSVHSGDLQCISKCCFR